MGGAARVLELVSGIASMAPVPVDERERLAELRSLDVLDTPAEERFDRIARLAARVFRTPIASIAFVDARRNFMKACLGLDLRAVERDTTFCAHTIIEAEALVVEDALVDERFAENPYVIGAPHLRFYAGFPVRGPRGHAVGALCVADVEPRTFSLEDRDTLRDLARLAEQELAVRHLGDAQRELVRELDEARRNALVDALTLAWNRRAADELLEREMARARREGTSVAVAMVDVDHFKRINDAHGHPFGDVVLRGVADRLRAAVRTHDAVARYGGEEFMIVLPGAGAREATVVAERIRAELARTPIEHCMVTASIGVSADATSSTELVASADRALYCAKRAGRNRVCGA